MISEKLHSTVGGSDKLYELYLAQTNEGYWNVMYANGRRSSGATSGHKPKNQAPIRARSSALQLLNKLVSDKLQEGYHFVGECSICEYLVANTRAKKQRCIRCQRFAILNKESFCKHCYNLLLTLPVKELTVNRIFAKSDNVAKDLSVKKERRLALDKDI